MSDSKTKMQSDEGKKSSLGDRPTAPATNDGSVTNDAPVKERKASQSLDDVVPFAELTPREQGIAVFYFVRNLSIFLGLLYFFLIGLSLMGNSLKVLGGRGAASVFELVNDPITGLMVGVFATVLVQSSSTSTSIVVGLVGSGSISVHHAIPIIMGANIGTSVTNTIVSLFHANDADEFELAFTGATMHDCFNILCVIILLPIELITGYLEAFSAAILPDSQTEEIESPIKIITKPITNEILKVDKSKIKAASKGEPVEGSLIKGGIFADSDYNDTSAGLILLVIALLILCTALALIVRFLHMIMKGRCAAVIRTAMEMNGYLALCVGIGLTVAVQSSSITTSTFVPLIALRAITIEKAFPLTLGANIGTTVTAFIASLAIDASTGASKKNTAVQIALCHLLFNITGILIWYPIPQMRKVPLSMARLLGQVMRKNRWGAIVYTAVLFVALPGYFIGLRQAGTAALISGGVLMFLFLAGVAAYIYLRLNRPELLPVKLGGTRGVVRKLGADANASPEQAQEA